MPPAPPGVQASLASIPAGTNAFDRLQAIRQNLYSKIVAAGPGKPVDILPGRVDQIIRQSSYDELAKRLRDKRSDPSRP